MRQQFATTRPFTDMPKIEALLTTHGGSSEITREACYNITILSASEAEICIYDLIGWDGITASQFLKELQAVKASTITLRINSDGGVVTDGLAIYNALLRHPATINAHVDGLAASTASFIAMAGDTVTMSPHSQMMIHEAFMVAGGPADFLRQQADALDKSSDNIAGIYADRAGGTVAEWRARMKEETWFSDQEAVDLGLADGIEGEDAEAVAARMQARLAPEVEPEPEPEPETEADTPPLDFMKQFEAIADEAEEAQYEVVGAE